MKRLINLLTLMALLMSWAGTAKAADVYLLCKDHYTVGDANYKFTQESTSNVYTYTMTAVPENAGGYFYMRIGVQGWDSDMGPYQANDELVSGREYHISDNCYNTNTWKVKIVEGATYKFTVDITEGEANRYVKVETITAPAATDFYLMGSATSWNENDALNYKFTQTADGSNIYTYALDATVLSGNMQLRIYKPNGDTKAYVIPTEANKALTSTADAGVVATDHQGKNWQVTWAENDEQYVFTLDNTNPSAPTLKVDITRGAAFDGTEEFYLVPTGKESYFTNKDYRFKFNRVRNRTTGVHDTNDRLRTVSFKAHQYEEWAGDGNLSFIVKGDKGTVYRPAQEVAFNQNGTVFQSQGGCKSTAGENKFNLTFDAETQSFTVYLNLGGQQGANRVLPAYSVSVETNKDLGEKADHKYYLVGNINNDGQDAGMDAKWEPNKFRPMIRKAFMNATNTEQCDSVVYSITVSKPVKGWGGMFLGVATDDCFNADGSFNWNSLIRPQVPDDKDAMAQRGCVFTAAGKGFGVNKEQALNPLITDGQYTSYTLHVNVTYSTYWIEFNKELYIVGGAVGNSMEEGQGTAMTYDENTGSWTYTGTFTEGGAFRFDFNRNFSVNFGEDKDDPNKEKEADTHYYNHVEMHNDGVEADTRSGRTEKDGTVSSQTDGDITFGLPTGEYTIRFYIVEREGKEAEYFYTIDEPVDVPDLKNKGKHIRTYSTPVDQDIPEGYKAYEAFSFTPAAEGTDITKENCGTLNLRKLTYIPAYTGVVLVWDGVEKKPFPARVRNLVTDETDLWALKGTNNYTDPWNNYLVEAVKGAKGIGEGKYTVTDGKYYYSERYFGLGYYSSTKGYDASKTDYLGFFRFTQTGGVGERKAYLSLPKSVINDNGQHIGGSYDDGAVYGRTNLMFDDEQGDATGIDNVNTNVNVKNDGFYYNMQGMRVANLTKGLYIHKGKKVIIK